VGSSSTSPHPSRFSASRALELCGRQQVAAVCYRISPRGPEFLLVRTRGGRWIFPKGGVQHGLTHAQSAALEAFEEAGVHGRIEEMPFTRYRVGKQSNGSRFRSRRKRHKPVIAHLCEVSHLERPQEAKRKPTWFSPEKAKKRLLEDRDPEFGDELAAVVDRAVSRIHRLETTAREPNKDELQQVTLEARATTRLPEGSAALIRYFLLEGQKVFSSRIEAARRAGVAPRIRKILQLQTTHPFERAPLRLGAGTPAGDPTRNITPIDRKTQQSPAKSRNFSPRKRS
jgi:8-oxo-dGTP pyrophosphatase MutT (NUDIX family)